MSKIVKLLGFLPICRIEEDEKNLFGIYLAFYRF